MICLRPLLTAWNRKPPTGPHSSSQLREKLQWLSQFYHRHQTLPYRTFYYQSVCVSRFNQYLPDFGGILRTERKNLLEILGFSHSPQEPWRIFRDVQAFNQALLAKIAWRFFTKLTSLLARILLSKYCHKSPFTKVSPGSATSHGRGILVGRDLLLKHLVKEIGNRENTNIWSDSWIHPESNLKPTGPIALQDKDLMVAEILKRETK